MSSRELIESLRRASNEKARVLCKEAEQEAEAQRLGVSRKVEELRRHYADQLAAAAREETQNALADAGRRARTLMLAAEKTLADRLLSLARASLRELRGEGYPAVFEKLANELPSLPWKLVRVHPADVGLARKCFPDAEIVAAEIIAGGVDAEIADGTIRVVNTFEKRLERSWGELLPHLMRDVRQEVAGGTSPESR